MLARSSSCSVWAFLLEKHEREGGNSRATDKLKNRSLFVHQQKRPAAGSEERGHGHKTLKHPYCTPRLAEGHPQSSDPSHGHSLEGFSMSTPRPNFQATLVAWQGLVATSSTALSHSRRGSSSTCGREYRSATTTGNYLHAERNTAHDYSKRNPAWLFNGVDCPRR